MIKYQQYSKYLFLFSIIHGTCISICIIGLIILAVLDEFGKNIFGTCSIKASSKVPVIGLILVFFYFLVGLYAIIYIKKYYPKT